MELYSLGQRSVSLEVWEVERLRICQQKGAGNFKGGRVLKILGRSRQHKMQHQTSTPKLRSMPIPPEVLLPKFNMLVRVRKVHFREFYMFLFSCSPMLSSIVSCYKMIYNQILPVPFNQLESFCGMGDEKFLG